MHNLNFTRHYRHRYGPNPPLCVRIPDYYAPSFLIITQHVNQGTQRLEIVRAEQRSAR